MSTTAAAATRKLATEVSECVLDIEDVLMGGDALPAELLQALAEDLPPLRDRLRRHLANPMRAKQAAKKPALPARNGKAKAKRACPAAARR